VQRWLLAAGVVTVVLARPRGADVAVLAGGVAAAAGLVGLSVLLVQSAFRSRQQRYRVQVWSYATASAFGGGGIVVGALLASGHGAAVLSHVHPIVMIWGFVGLVVITTLPTFAATTLRMKPSPLLSQPRLGATAGAYVAGIAVATVGAATDTSAVGAAGLGLAAIALLVCAVMLPRPTRRAVDYSGPRGVGIGAATVWWIAVTIWVAAEVASGSWPTGARPIVVLILGGMLQMIWAAVAYFAPVLRGGGPGPLTEGFAVMRSWVSLAAFNAAALGAALGAGTLAAVLLGIVVVDTAWRIGRLLATRP
jgi:hypothetical protein